MARISNTSLRKRTNSIVMKQLMKIDAEMVEVEQLRDKALREELESGRTTLLMSNVHQARLDRLSRNRANIQRSMFVKLSRQETYAIELRERQLAVTYAIDRRDDIARSMALILSKSAITAAGSIDPDESQKIRYRELMRQLKSQELVIKNKVRAVQNWLDKDFNTLPVRRDSMQKLSPANIKAMSIPDFQGPIAKDDFSDIGTPQERRGATAEDFQKYYSNDRPSGKYLTTPIINIDSPPESLNVDVKEEKEEKSLDEITDPMDPANMKYKPPTI